MCGGTCRWWSCPGGLEGGWALGTRVAVGALPCAAVARAGWERGADGERWRGRCGGEGGGGIGRSKQAGWEGDKKRKGKGGKSRERKDERAGGSTAAAPRTTWAALTRDWDISRMQGGLNPLFGQPPQMGTSPSLTDGFQNLTLSARCSIRLSFSHQTLAWKVLALCDLCNLLRRGEKVEKGYTPCAEHPEHAQPHSCVQLQ